MTKYAFSREMAARMRVLPCVISPVEKSRRPKRIPAPDYPSLGVSQRLFDEHSAQREDGCIAIASPDYR